MTAARRLAPLTALLPVLLGLFPQGLAARSLAQVLGELSARQGISFVLEGSAGLFRLKEELLRRINLSVYPAKVEGVLFKEILVQ